MASIGVVSLPYPSGPTVESVQQPVLIPQHVSAADKRVSQTSGSFGTTINPDGKRKMQVGPRGFGRTCPRGGSDDF